MGVVPTSSVAAFWDRELAMSMPLTVEQLNGQSFILEVMPDMTMRQVKQQIKDMQTWEDGVRRDIMVVEVMLGDKKLKSDETVAETGLSPHSKVSVLFRPNVARCANQSAWEPSVDPDTLVVVEIPESETEVGESAFLSCERVVEVIIPHSVTRIGDRAFYGCEALTDVTIPDSVTWIGDAAFLHCSSLASMTIPNSVTHIGDSAFSACTSLRNLFIGESVTHISPYAFVDCASLSSLTIPGSVIHIGSEAFRGCASLTSVTIPETVPYIGAKAFADCPLLTFTTPEGLPHPVCRP